MQKPCPKSGYKNNEVYISGQESRRILNMEKVLKHNSCFCDLSLSLNYQLHLYMYL